MDWAIGSLFWLRHPVTAGKVEWRRGRVESGKEEHKGTTGRGKGKKGTKKTNQREEAMKNKAISTHGYRKP